MLSSRRCAVGESYVAGTPVVRGGILIIGNFIFAARKPLKYSIFTKEKFICAFKAFIYFAGKSKEV